MSNSTSITHNGISMEDLKSTCLGYSVVAGEIGAALRAIAEHLDCIGEARVSGDVYLLKMLSKRASKLADDVDSMPFDLKSMDVRYE